MREAPSAAGEVGTISKIHDIRFALSEDLVLPRSERLLIICLGGEKPRRAAKIYQCISNNIVTDLPTCRPNNIEISVSPPPLAGSEGPPPLKNKTLFGALSVR